ncbi:MAG TPA: cytochrome c [Alphaproteobacteria bacterium]
MPTRGRFGEWTRTAAVCAAAVLFCAVGLRAAGPAQAQAPAADAIARGQYIFDAAGCTSCHTDEKNKGQLLAGGVPLKTPFGTFYGPNITPDPTHGIGGWSEADVIRALRDGKDDDGDHLFPVFPYTSFTKMTDADAKDLWAYLRSVPPTATPSKPHDIGFPFNIRLAQMFWKRLFFTPGRFQPDPAKSAEVNRGAYIVQALGHCGECHTQRNLLGGMDTKLFLAGNTRGPDGHAVPNITPDPDTGIGKWSDRDLVDLFKEGMTPDGDFVGGAMAEVVRHSTSKLTDSDIHAVIAYVRSLSPVRNRIEEKKAQ